MDYLKRAHELYSVLVSNRRALHRRPETGCHVPETSDYIRRQLERMGIQTEACGAYGLTGIIGTNASGPTLLLRSDMDALPMDEASGLPFASEIPGRAHCCGHDTHAAMLLGAAQMLKENEQALCGRVKLMFQPGEETGDGCREMLAAGILNNPVPDAALGFHVDAASPLGYISWGQGPTFCSNDTFTLTVAGQSCHGARPHQGKDAVNCSAHIILALQTLIAREADPSAYNVLTICSVESSSTAFNIFPDHVIMKGSLRTYDNAQREYLKKRLEDVSALTAQSFGCTCAVTYVMSTGTVVLNDAMEEEMKTYLAQALSGEATLSKTPVRKMGGDDFAAITELLPSAYFFIGAGIDEAHPFPYGQHDSRVVFNEQCLPLGAAGIAACASCWLAAHA